MYINFILQSHVLLYTKYIDFVINSYCFYIFISINIYIYLYMLQIHKLVLIFLKREVLNKIILNKF